MRTDNKRPRPACNRDAAEYLDRSHCRTGWLRVNRRRRCPICDHADWCLVATDGNAAICPRVESGRRAGAAGYLHKLRDDTHRPGRCRRVHVAARPDASGHIDFGALARCYAQAVDPDRLRLLAEALGVSVDSLRRLGVGHDAEAWTFPMFDPCCGPGLRVVGIRRRLPSGRKLSVRGGHEGLFIPIGMAGTDPILIAEGPTDTAALLDLGLDCMGRPSCTGGAWQTVERVKGRDVVIVADGDAPGRRGAQTLASGLRVYCRSVRIIEPPNGRKDAREWVRAGASRSDVLEVIDAAMVPRLSVVTRRVGT